MKTSQSQIKLHGCEVDLYLQWLQIIFGWFFVQSDLYINEIDILALSPIHREQQTTFENNASKGIIAHNQ